MAKLAMIAMSFIALTAAAYAAPAPSPGPLLGAVAGPWGLIASGLAYGAYRLCRAKR